MEGDRGNYFRAIGHHADALLAIGVIGLLLLLIVPLPPFFLDAFLCVSIILSVMVLLLTFYAENALEFSAFPSVLLFLTLFRLTLNIASTRMILTKGEAGDIIETFGAFVIQGNEIVGLLLFCLLTLINFIVVTKGAGRIAEVAARFTLEALPGKQMAIDSELSAGLISQTQAKEERKKIASESDFYGSMDGASKFVKGDAIAGVIITFVNIVGGIVIGVALKKMSWQECWTTISRLTIGDGLVTQIPALLVSIAAAMMVTRASSGSLGKMIPRQIFRQPKVLMITAGMLLVLALIPGMPIFLMVSLSGLLFAAGYLQLKREAKGKKLVANETKWDSFLVAPIEIQLGCQALTLAQPFQDKLGDIREKIAHHLGIRIPAVHISDALDLPASGWSILIKGVRVASGREFSPLVKQFTEVVKLHAHELINRQDVTLMLQEVKRHNSAVIDELYPKKLSLGQILKVLQHLLKERIPVRDLVTILEILADHATGEKSDIGSLIEEVRQGLGKKISEEFIGKSKSAHVITIDPKIEQMLTLSKGIIRPKTIDQLARAIVQFDNIAQQQGIKPIIVTAVSSRAQLRLIIEKCLPAIPVLSYKEIASDINLVSIGLVPSEVLI
jgi:flagellar biosynthesis protein FlhA